MLCVPALPLRMIAPIHHSADGLGALSVRGGGRHPVDLDAALA